MKKSLVYTARAAIIAALYFALSVALSAISFGPVQFRISEILVLLPIIFPEAIPGLTIGCFFTNFFFSPFGVFDMVLGTLATLIGAVGTYLLRRRPLLATLPPIIANTLLVPLIFVLNDASSIYYISMFEILASQIITCIVFGSALYVCTQKGDDCRTYSSSPLIKIRHATVPPYIARRRRRRGLICIIVATS